MEVVLCRRSLALRLGFPPHHQASVCAITALRVITKDIRSKLQQSGLLTALGCGGSFVLLRTQCMGKGPDVIASVDVGIVDDNVCNILSAAEDTVLRVQMAIAIVYNAYFCGSVTHSIEA